MNQNISYGELYMRLASETAMIRFLKKNGEIRLMLATRNMDTASSLYDYLGGQLAGHDKRCNIKNNNMAVIDLEIGEARSFLIDLYLQNFLEPQILLQKQKKLLKLLISLGKILKIVLRNL